MTTDSPRETVKKVLALAHAQDTKLPMTYIRGRACCVVISYSDDIKTRDWVVIESRENNKRPTKTQHTANQRRTAEL